ncbi:YggS family pyridoxal phosphate enzyme [Alicyclobacillus hesperidum subsp. aegles]|uniref:YggS family pyridoxal phosphate-dependent enzyme n=1 Tax=Alicyclobacillus hesperidum TaxID=89784 RepID=UPI002229EAB3|nr:YggS family pyridoxal phosphate-dependent enzyme [Alicyclobacillus hesperidum]GLG01097.1 YggS family pyridoxal phosphate enzyme [Alicyclobacillus hesperidum subsp. aegles]
MDFAYVQENVAAIRLHVEAACAKAGRDPADVRVIAVTKTAPPDILPALPANGITDAAENRWQAAREKLMHPAATQLTWHFIGTLQTNKVKYVAPRFDWVHSVDRLELALALAEAAQRLARTLNVLIQVNVAQESQKHGFPPEACLEAATAMIGMPNLVLRGLMTMAPQVDDPEQVRPVFRTLRELRDDLQSRLSLATFDQLSMGMSQDFPVAIEEGATMIRVGRRLVNP